MVYDLDFCNATSIGTSYESYMTFALFINGCLCVTGTMKQLGPYVMLLLFLSRCPVRLVSKLCATELLIL